MAAQIIQLPGARPGPVQNPPSKGGAWPRGVLSIGVARRKRNLLTEADASRVKELRAVTEQMNGIPSLSGVAATFQIEVNEILNSRIQRRY